VPYDQNDLADQNLCRHDRQHYRQWFSGLSDTWNRNSRLNTSTWIADWKLALRGAALSRRQRARRPAFLSLRPPGSCIEIGDCGPVIGLLGLRLLRQLHAMLQFLAASRTRMGTPHAHEEPRAGRGQPFIECSRGYPGASEWRLPQRTQLPQKTTWGDLPIIAGDGISKSAASRRFVALSAERLAEWMASDPSELGLLVIQIDGLHIGNDPVLVAGSVSMGTATKIRSAWSREQPRMPRRAGADRQPGAGAIRKSAGCSYGAKALSKGHPPHLRPHADPAPRWQSAGPLPACWKRPKDRRLRACRFSELRLQLVNPSTSPIQSKTTLRRAA
jgi:hypothetical protein